MACYKEVSRGVVRGWGGGYLMEFVYDAIIEDKANQLSVHDALLKDWMQACLLWGDRPRVAIYNVHYKMGAKEERFDRWVVWQNQEIQWQNQNMRWENQKIPTFPRVSGVCWIPMTKGTYHYPTMIQQKYTGFALHFYPDRDSDMGEGVGEHCRAVRLHLFKGRIPVRARTILLQCLKSLFLRGEYDDNLQLTIAPQSRIQYIDAASWRSGAARPESVWCGVGGRLFFGWEHEVFDCLPFAHIGLMQQAYGAYGEKVVSVMDCTPMEYPVY